MTTFLNPYNNDNNISIIIIHTNKHRQTHKQETYSSLQKNSWHKNIIYSSCFVYTFFLNRSTDRECKKKRNRQYNKT